MKREELLRIINSIGCVFVRHGANHDWYKNPQTGRSQPIPRHKEIEDGLAKESLRDYRRDVSKWLHRFADKPGSQ